MHILQQQCRMTPEVQLLCSHTPTIYPRPDLAWLLLLQLDLYSAFLHSKRMNALLFGHGSDSEGVLPAITILRKMCNHPRLLLPDPSKDQGASSAQQVQQQGLGQVRLADLAVQLLQQQMERCSTPLDAVQLSGRGSTYDWCAGCGCILAPLLY